MKTKHVLLYSGLFSLLILSLPIVGISRGRRSNPTYYVKKYFQDLEGYQRLRRRGGTGRRLRGLKTKLLSVPRDRAIFQQLSAHDQELIYNSLDKVGNPYDRDIRQYYQKKKRISEISDRTMTNLTAKKKELEHNISVYDKGIKKFKEQLKALEAQGEETQTEGTREVPKISTDGRKIDKKVKDAQGNIRHYKQKITKLEQRISDARRRGDDDIADRIEEFKYNLEDKIEEQEKIIEESKKSLGKQKTSIGLKGKSSEELRNIKDKLKRAEQRLERFKKGLDEATDRDGYRHYTYAVEKAEKEVKRIKSEYRRAETRLQSENKKAKITKDVKKSKKYRNIEYNMRNYEASKKMLTQELDQVNKSIKQARNNPEIKRLKTEMQQHKSKVPEHLFNFGSMNYEEIPDEEQARIKECAEKINDGREYEMKYDFYKKILPYRLKYAKDDAEKSSIRRYLATIKALRDRPKEDCEPIQEKFTSAKARFLIRKEIEKGKAFRASAIYPNLVNWFEGLKPDNDEKHELVRELTEDQKRGIRNFAKKISQKAYGTIRKNLKPRIRTALRRAQQARIRMGRSGSRDNRNSTDKQRVNRTVGQYFQLEKEDQAYERISREYRGKTATSTTLASS